MPLAGEKVAAEIEQVCNPETCKHLNEWLNQLFLYRTQLSYYKESLNK